MPLPTPRADESQSDFVSRCHEALAGEFPETDQRNAVCFRQWRETRGGSDAVERKAREKFGNDQFVKIPDVCVFAEHTAKDKDENTVVYDKAALEKIAARCNDRILDTGDFAPITLGHTPTEEEIAAGVEMPDIAGYAGNFRVGLKGNKKPRWAIFADEYHHADVADQLRKRPRRSVELWTEERMEDRFFDPIAALGAETPRLDLGLAYARRLAPSGKRMAKYAARSTRGYAQKFAAVASAPGAGSVSPKKYESNGKAPFDPAKSVERPDKAIRNAADSGAPPAAAPAQQTQGGGMALTPEDCQMIVGAIEQLDWVQWVKGKMQEESGAHDDEASGGDSSHDSSGDSSGHEDFGHDSSGSPSGHHDDASAHDGIPSGSPSDDDEGSPSHYAAGEGDNDGDISEPGEIQTSPDNTEKKCRDRKYAAGSLQGDVTTTTGQSVEEKPVNTTGATVAKPELMKLARKADEKDRFRKLEKRLEKVEAENAELRKERTAALRFSRLSELKSEGYIFEIAEELADSADFSDSQFDRHCDRIKKYQRAPVGEKRLYVPDSIPGDDRNPDKYSIRHGELVKELHARNIKAGKQVPFSEVQAQATAELAKAGVTKTA